MTAAVGVDLTERTAALGPELRPLADLLLGWLESGARSDHLFSDDVRVDLTVPHWRLQSRGTEAAFRLRAEQHPYAGSVRIECLAATDRGFLMAFEERWAADGQRWYCREMLHAVVADSRIAVLSVYCTGDWDEDLQRRYAATVSVTAG
ncbi:MAG TPA: hypothetical protein VFP34_17620 [Microlunatus sp.]|nr:hypothetical protein [Microlunatus sp.]